MDIIEFVPDRSMSAVIRDIAPRGPLEIRSRMTTEPIGAGQTTLTFHLEIPSPDATLDPSMIEGSLSRIKELIEAET